MSVWSVKVINSMAHIVSEGEADNLDYDFLTGDFSPSIPASSSAFLFGGTLGTTLSATATAPTNTIQVTSTAGATIGEWCAVVLDDSTQYYAVVLDILGPILTLSRNLPSDATSGNQVVYQSQLSGATDFTSTEDFKFSKANEIIANTINLRTAEVPYDNTGFIPTDQLIGDAAGYLTSGRDADQFNAVTGLGLSRAFTDEDDLADFTYTITGYVDNLTAGQGSLIDQVYDAANTQVAMDAIVDSRDSTPPSLTNPLSPFVRFTSNTRTNVRIKPDSASGTALYEVRDFADTLTGMAIGYNDASDTGVLQAAEGDMNIFAKDDLVIESLGTGASDNITFEVPATPSNTSITLRGDLGASNAILMNASDGYDLQGGVFNVNSTAEVQLTAATDVDIRCDSTVNPILLRANVTDGQVLEIRSLVGLGVSSDFYVLSATNPEGTTTAGPGSIAVDVDTTSTPYFKTTGAGNTGWRTMVGGPSVIMFGDATLQQSTATRYLTPGYDAGGAPTVAMRYPVPRDGVIEDMRISCRAAPGNGNNVVYTLRVNSVASALAVTLASDTLDGSATGAVAVSAGDILDIEVTKATAIGSSLNDVLCTLNLY